MLGDSSNRQIPIHFAPETSVTRDDLVESPSNAMAVAMIDSWPDWPGNLALICGPEGSGKTHITAAWSALANARTVAVGANAQSELDAGFNLILEDIDDTDFDENALFHTFNAVRQAGGYCLMTARSTPGDWGLELPDLVSRMKTVQLVQLLEPDDLLLKQVMMKLFSDRQLQVDGRVIDYCLLRMERSLGFAKTLVEALDAEALSRKSAITKLLAGSVIERLGAD